MSVVVRMEMPSCCHDCPFEADQWDYPICRVTRRSEGYRFDSRNNRMADCPIVCSLPEGHGRLIDAGTFEKDISDALVCGLKEMPSEEGKQLFHALMQEVLDNVKKRKTIIPAERSE